MNNRKMTEEEQTATLLKSLELRKEGREEEASEMLRTVPLPPYLAKIAKEEYGADFLVENGFNLVEAEEAYGKDWLKS